MAACFQLAMSLRLWLLVMFPANFFSFLVDELARLTVWLTVGASEAHAEQLRQAKVLGACSSTPFLGVWLTVNRSASSGSPCLPRA